MASDLLRDLPWQWLGRLPFAQALAVNEATAAARRREVLIFEPAEPVLTLGRRASRAAARLDLAPTLALCARRGIAVLPADRGGLATLHLPGQLVLFVSLPAPLPSVRALVSELLGAAAAMAAAAGLEPITDLDSEVGVYCSAGKLASAGLRIRNRVVRHGISLNVAIDPELARGLTLCGSSTRGFASLHPPGHPVRPVATALAGHLGLVERRLPRARAQ